MAAKASSIAVTIPRGAITSSGRLQKAKRLLLTTLQYLCYSIWVIWIENIHIFL